MRPACLHLTALLVWIAGPLLAAKELPPPLSQLAGPYVGSVAGSTAQRLVLNADGTGIFAEVWFDAELYRATYYSVKTISYEGWQLQLELTPLLGDSKPVRASGSANYFEIALRLPAISRFRKRTLTLFRETLLLDMLDIARRQVPYEERPHAAATVVPR